MDKILVVDDDLDILSLMDMTLSMNGFKVETISQWEGIDDCIKQFSPEVILLDISLSGADGRDICKRLKKDNYTKHIPIVLFSANTELGVDYQACQAAAFIAKPFELSELLKTIRGAVRN